MADMDETVQENIDEDISQRGILFELESFVIDGRKMIFDSIKPILKKKKIELMPMQFSRYCPGKPIMTALSQLLEAIGGAKLDSAKLIEEIKKSYLSSLAKVTQTKKESLALLKKAKKDGLFLGAVTDLDPEVSETILKAAGLAEDDVELLQVNTEGRLFPSTNDLRKLAKIMFVKPLLCTVVATSAAAAKSALSAHMRCFAIPDEFTAWEDYSGADYVVDELDNTAAKAIIELANSR